VFIGRLDLPGTPVPYVAVDYAAAVAGAVDRLASLGHRTVAYLGGRVCRGPQEQRRAAFAEHARGAGLTTPTDALMPLDAVTPEWLGAVLGSVTALMIETFELAEAVAGAAKRYGCEVPRDLSAVCLDSPPPGSPAAVWSYTAIPRREMGARAVALLLAVLDGDLPAGYIEILSCEPINEGSIAPPPHR
jgi:DNA-binding LacI/PurR family transcriptional regulator